MSFFIESAIAEGAANTPGSDPMSLMIMIAVFALVFYFMIWRPQAKRSKEHKSLMSSLSKGNEVVTNGGIIGKISKVTEDFVVITIAEGVDIVFQKASISSVLPKGTIKSI